MEAEKLYGVYVKDTTLYLYDFYTLIKSFTRYEKTPPGSGLWEKNHEGLRVKISQ